MPTNQEFTTWPKDDFSRHNDTLFQIQLAWDAPESEPFKSKSGYFKLIHMPTRVALWTHTTKALPDWAFKQQEINGNKNPSERSAIWYAEDIIADQCTRSTFLSFFVVFNILFFKTAMTLPTVMKTTDPSRSPSR
jgi:dolichyl-phosphate-mannose-protein mannosyltransferase